MSVETHPIRIIQGAESLSAKDSVAVESPLQIRLSTSSNPQTIDYSVTMRTPDHDIDLAVGYLFSEGIIQKANDIQVLEQDLNSIHLRLINQTASAISPRSAQRLINSACGLCGISSIEAIETVVLPKLRSGPVVDPQIFDTLPTILQESQSSFQRTGGVHASALFSTEGKLIELREDVGRHNALDKLIGAMLRRKTIPFHNTILLVSGRVSYELTQKALMAGIPILAAIGAPSSLAIRLAEDFGQTLIGFLRPGRFNIYSGFERIQTTSLSPVDKTHE